MSQNRETRFEADENKILEMAVYSAIGDRDEQQDEYGFALSPKEGIAIVCDGMGGFEDGGQASHCAVESLLNSYFLAKQFYSPKQYLKESMKTADEEVAAIGKESGGAIRVGSTAIAIVIKEHQLFWASVGDSRAYLLRGKEFVQFTQDHNYQTVLDEQLRVGVLTEKEYLEEARRGGALISYIGMGNVSLIDYNESPLELMPGDRIIAMTDGLYRLVSDSEIRSILRGTTDIRQAVQMLGSQAEHYAAEKQLSQDNTTMILIRVK